ncbi:EamA family transporter [Thermomonas fusca]
MSSLFPWLMVASTILFTTYGQLILKWQVTTPAAAPFRFMESWPTLLLLLLRPWVISAFVAAFLASLCWMMAISRLPLSKAYPFMAINFLLVGLLAIPLFGEALTRPKIVGLVVVVVGLSILSKG